MPYRQIFQIATVIAISLSQLPCAVSEEAVGAPERLHVQASIHPQLGRQVPEVVFDVGEVLTGEVIEVEITFFNNLSDKIVFDDVRTSCSCQHIEPKHGVIPVGGKLRLTLKLSGVDRPRETKMLGFLRFIKKGREVVTARFSCNYSAYYGFLDSVTAVSYREEMGKQLKFDIPIAVGERLDPGSFEFTLEGLDGGQGNFEMDAGASVVHARIELEQPPKTQRLFGKLSMFSDQTGYLASADLIVQPIQAIRIMPGLLAFSQDEDGGDYKARAFVRIESDDDEASKSPDSAFITLSGESCNFKVDSKSLSGGIWQTHFSISEARQKTLFEASSNRDSPVNLSIRVVCGKDILSRRISATFKEFER